MKKKILKIGDFNLAATPQIVNGLNGGLIYGFLEHSRKINKRKIGACHKKTYFQDSQPSVTQPGLPSY